MGSQAVAGVKGDAGGAATTRFDQPRLFRGAFGDDPDL
jgi:hypothetical protein